MHEPFIGIRGKGQSFIRLAHQGIREKKGIQHETW